MNDKFVENMIKKNPPKTEDEMIVQKIYDAYKFGEPDEWGHKGIKYENPLILDL